MSNAFLEQADKQWARNGLFIEDAILLLSALMRGVEFTNEELQQCQTNLLTTLMVDTPSGMFESALAYNGERPERKDNGSNSKQRD